LKILPDLSTDHPVFITLEFASTFFYTARSSGLLPTSNLEDQVSVFMPYSDRVAQLYPQVSGSLYATFYDSQGYIGLYMLYGMVRIIIRAKRSYTSSTDVSVAR
jgi:hypothetical protein